jgi:hypothetical protein
MIELILTLAAIAYGTYYSIRKKNYRFFYVALVMISIQLPKQPFFLSKNYALSFLAFSFGLAHLYVYSYKNKIKDAFMYSLVFFILGMFFLIRSAS